ncbi:MAG: hypothetical protein R2733_24480 [Acidimicrobiales bacterium]
MDWIDQTHADLVWGAIHEIAPGAIRSTRAPDVTGLTEYGDEFHLGWRDSEVSWPPNQLTIRHHGEHSTIRIVIAGSDGGRLDPLADALAEKGLRGGWIATDVARAPLWRTEIASGYEAGPGRLTIDQLPLYPQHLWLHETPAAALDVGLAGKSMPISDGVHLTGTRDQMRSVLHPLNGLLSVVARPASAYWLEGPVATAFVAADTYQALQERQRGEHTRQEVSLVRVPLVPDGPLGVVPERDEFFADLTVAAHHLLTTVRRWLAATWDHPVDPASDFVSTDLQVDGNRFTFGLAGDLTPTQSRFLRAALQSDARPLSPRRLFAMFGITRWKEEVEKATRDLNLPAAASYREPYRC